MEMLAHGGMICGEEVKMIIFALPFVAAGCACAKVCWHRVKSYFGR